MKRLKQIFKRLKEILSWEMSKMPLGAKLTKKMTQIRTLEWSFNKELNQRLIQAKLKDSETIFRI